MSEMDMLPPSVEPFTRQMSLSLRGLARVNPFFSIPREDRKMSSHNFAAHAPHASYVSTISSPEKSATLCQHVL
jgi:hypothetical protein